MLRLNRYPKISNNDSEILSKAHKAFFRLNLEQNQIRNNVNDDSYLYAGLRSIK